MPIACDLAKVVLPLHPGGSADQSLPLRGSPGSATKTGRSVARLSYRPLYTIPDGRGCWRRLWHLLAPIALVLRVPTPAPRTQGQPERPPPVGCHAEALRPSHPHPPRADRPGPLRPRLSCGLCAPGTAPPVRAFPGPRDATLRGPGWHALLVSPRHPGPPLSHTAALAWAHAV